LDYNNNYSINIGLLRENGGISAMSNAKILIVEDEFIVAAEIKRKLENWNFNVPAIVSSGEEAIRMSNKLNPDLILMDIVLKGDMDGIAATEKINDILDVPVIYLTAYGNNNIINRAVSTKPYAYILKPFEENELKIAVDIALYKHVADKKMKEKEKKLNYLVQNTPAVIYTADPSPPYRNNYISENIRKQMGYKPLEFIKNPNFWADLIHPDDYPMVFQEMPILFDKGSLVHEYRFLGKDGNYHWIYDEMNLVRDVNGIPLEIVGYRIDISERKRFEEALKKAHDNLEKRVRERTLELAKVNETLKNEIYERKNAYKSLFKSGVNFRNVINRNADGIVVVDKEGIVLFVNPAAEALFNLNSDEIVGESFGFPLVGGETAEINIIPKGRDMVTAEMRVVETEWEDKKAYLASLRDITERLMMESKIKRSLNEKESLLREIHHRVKNNLQIISSLLSLQSGYFNDEYVIDVLKESQNRVKSMAMIHEKLYLSEDLSRINFSEYIKGLALDLLSSYGVNPNNIRLNIDVGNITVGIDTAIPLGLIINEIISNSIKHAFPDGKGEINIIFDYYMNKYKLKVNDDGIGIPKDVDFKNTDTLGLRLVNNLVKQLDGEIKLKKLNGTEFKIIFPELKYKKRM
jgi:PAS domain S-box-containing protein